MTKMKLEEYKALKAPCKKSKYHNTRISVDGIKFDSRAESNRYLVLKDKLRKGEIHDLKLQVPYILIPPNDKYPRGTVYKADFVYKDKAGREVVEDVKGYKTDVYKLKRKLMYAVHGIEIAEIMEATR